MRLLEVKSIQKNYGDEPVIKDIDLHLNEGELVCLLGVSGVGKTTLFNVIAGLYQPDQGSIYLKGKDITKQAGHISYMLQKDLLLPYKTILQNLMLPLQLKGIRKATAREEVVRQLAVFGLEETVEKYPHQLSGGMRQRAALLRTYFASEGVMLLDEPFSALDTLTKSTMHAWFIDLMERLSLSSIFITHDIDEAVLLADRVYILSGKPGQISAEIKIDLPRPRQIDFAYSETFLDYKREIREALGL